MRAEKRACAGTYGPASAHAVDTHRKQHSGSMRMLQPSHQHRSWKLPVVEVAATLVRQPPPTAAQKCWGQCRAPIRRRRPRLRRRPPKTGAAAAAAGPPSAATTLGGYRRWGGLAANSPLASRWRATSTEDSRSRLDSCFRPDQRATNVTTDAYDGVSLCENRSEPSDHRVARAFSLLGVCAGWIDRLRSIPGCL